MKQLVIVLLGLYISFQNLGSLFAGEDTEYNRLKKEIDAIRQLAKKTGLGSFLQDWRVLSHEARRLGVHKDLRKLREDPREDFINNARVIITKLRLVNVAKVVDTYRIRYSKYPDELSTLKKKGLLSEYKDEWGYHFRYNVLHKGFSISSLGADGKTGGSAKNKDIEFFYQEGS
jgi:hypothetical protein